MANLKLSPGVITGNALKELFAYCKEVDCALPSVNAIGSSSANAALAAAKEAKAPVIIQFSQTGAQFIAFSATTRLSGVEIGGRRLRKGAVDAVIKFAVQAGMPAAGGVPPERAMRSTAAVKEAGTPPAAGMPA